MLHKNVARFSCSKSYRNPRKAIAHYAHRNSAQAPAARELNQVGLASQKWNFVVPQPTLAQSGAIPEQTKARGLETRYSPGTTSRKSRGRQSREWQDRIQPHRKRTFAPSSAHWQPRCSPDS
ncbi:hypothetical protein C8T65DRAFT_218288 [Cerioporus squamosus]|nr:hypothetical protein C8T65DRAFT_218288 [Cerioporus squamosus]